MEVDCAVSLVSVMDDKEGKFESAHQLSCENYEAVNIFANLYQITEVLYPLRKIQKMHILKLRVFI